MGYWMYVCSQADEVMEFETIRDFDGEDVRVELCFGEAGAEWKQISIDHPDGTPITLLERLSGERAAGNVAEDLENLAVAEPRCNAEWVADFLRGVKTIYLFQILSGVDVNDGWDYLRDLMHEMCEGYEGILYAEGEGFSNETGYHVTWEFSERASGEWWMALYDARTDDWRCFQMELSNPAHREAFCSGRVPEGVKVS
jgi:hypothetical protein